MLHSVAIAASLLVGPGPQDRPPTPPPRLGVPPTPTDHPPPTGVPHPARPGVAWRPPPPPQRQQPAPTFLPTTLLPLVLLCALMAQKQKRDDHEGPHMPDAPDHEYKILRSSMHRFAKPELLRQALADEARYGWTLFEKIDDGRLRLRRLTACRSGDAAVGGDPYRSAANIGDGAAGLKQALLVVLVVVSGAAAGFVAWRLLK